jgi:putative membrane protein
MPYDDLPYYHMMNHYPFLWTSLMWVLVVIVVMYLIYRLIKSEKILVPDKKPRSAEDILIERYAKGELTRDQFMQIRGDIKPDDT